MAEAAALAARDEAPTILKAADQAGPNDLLKADRYIFCAPENLAAIAGVMKDFSTGAIIQSSGVLRHDRTPL